MNHIVQHQTSTTQGVTLTDKARQHLLTYLTKAGDCQGVRFSVKKTGCSGLSYVVDYVSQAEADDVREDLNESYSLYIAKASYPFLKGMRVDYVREGLNGKLVFDNPNQTGACGCGESFTVE